MRSNGGVCTIDEAIAQPVDMLLSGPAGGVVGAMKMVGLGENRDLLTFDLGGTSCDLSVVRKGEAVSSTFLPRHTRFEGWDVLRPFLDIHALGAGGGSIAWVDGAGGLHVGPRSAGAVPGPACYGNGGEEATVSDADLLLGYLNPDYFLGSELKLDRDAAERALATVGARCGLDTIDVAAGVFEIVNASMADRIRVVLADTGADPREFTLLCFGGAGGVHAPAIMADLGLRRVVIPRLASTFSAYGLLLSDVRQDLVRTLAKPLASAEDGELHALFEEMETNAAAWLESMPSGVSSPSATYSHSADLRYTGQSHEMRVAVGGSRATATSIARQFESSYSALYGYINDPALIELVNVRVVASAATRKPSEAATVVRSTGDEQGPTEKGIRDAYFSEPRQWLSAAVYDGNSLRAGHEASGPAILELPSTTIVVRPGQRWRVDADDNIVIDHSEAQ
jgi:N-methylhydantoinase A